jgi:hypothetical protein
MANLRSAKCTRINNSVYSMAATVSYINSTRSGVQKKNEFHVLHNLTCLLRGHKNDF